MALEASALRFEGVTTNWCGWIGWLAYPYDAPTGRIREHDATTCDHMEHGPVDTRRHASMQALAKTIISTTIFP